MTAEDLVCFKKWFSDYTESFHSSNEEDQKNITLKIRHTYNVCNNAIAISKGSLFSENQIRVAGAIALFHDIGRFPQYAEYKTFRDAVSVNHGLLGSKILVKANVLQPLSHYEQQLIIQSVKFHNAFAIPKTVNSETDLFLRLIRDADKVDIFRVFLEYYEGPREDRASATAFNVPDTPEYSSIMLSCIVKKHVASYSNIRTENDFKLMKLSWIYDIHFRESLRLIQENNYIDRIVEKLPQTDEIISSVALLKKYVSERLNTDER